MNLTGMNRFLFLFTLRQGCFIMAAIYICMRGFVFIKDIYDAVYPDPRETHYSQKVDIYCKMFWNIYFVSLVIILFFGAYLQSSWLMFTYSSLTYYKIVMETTYRLFLAFENTHEIVYIIKHVCNLVMDLYFLIISYNYYLELEKRKEDNVVRNQIVLTSG
jgi:hypothetical protein